MRCTTLRACCCVAAPSCRAGLHRLSRTLCGVALQPCADGTVAPHPPLAAGLAQSACLDCRCAAVVDHWVADLDFRKALATRMPPRLYAKHIDREAACHNATIRSMSDVVGGMGGGACRQLTTPTS